MKTIFDGKVECEIKILQIRGFNVFSPSRIRSYYDSVLLSRTTSFKWEINRNVLSNIALGASYCSDAFDNCWCLQLTKKINKNLCLFLKLLALPPKIWRIQVQIKLASNYTKEAECQKTVKYSYRRNTEELCNLS